MAENFIESEIVSDNGVDHINLRVDSDKLTAFQDTLKGTRDNNAMNAFIDKLSTLVELKAKADDLRKKQGNVLIIERPNVGGVDIVAAVPVDSEVALHNEKIRAIHQAIKEFNASRTEFLKTFIARYISQPAPVRTVPAVGTRGTPKPAGDDMFSQSIRDSIRGAKPTRADTPDVQVGRNTLTGALAALAGGGKPPSEGGVLDENGNLRGPQAARIAADFGGSDRYKANTDKK